MVFLQDICMVSVWMVTSMFSDQLPLGRHFKDPDCGHCAGKTKLTVGRGHSVRLKICGVRAGDRADRPLLSELLTDRFEAPGVSQCFCPLRGNKGYLRDVCD